MFDHHSIKCNERGCGQNKSTGRLKAWVYRRDGQIKGMGGAKECGPIKQRKVQNKNRVHSATIELLVS